MTVMVPGVNWLFLLPTHGRCKFLHLTAVCSDVRVQPARYDASVQITGQDRLFPPLSPLSEDDFQGSVRPCAGMPQKCVHVHTVQVPLVMTAGRAVGVGGRCPALFTRAVHALIDLVSLKWRNCTGLGSLR